MTQDKLQEATEAANALQKAKNELNSFRVLKAPLQNQQPYAVKSKITITICDGKLNQKRDIVLPSDLVKHLYSQELNRLRAKVHHLTTAFERI